MEKRQIDYEALILKYKEKDPTVAEAIEILQNKYVRQQKTIKIFRHDMRGPLIAIGGLSNPKKWQILSEEKRNERILVMHTSAQVANERMGLLDLADISRDELRRYSENIIITDLAKTHSMSVENYLTRMSVGLYLKSSTTMNIPLKIYAHKAAMGSIIENLIGGGLNHAPEKSKIKMGIRENKGYLEIMTENVHLGGKRIRDIAGEARGLGLPFIEEIMKAMGGTFEKYDYQRINRKYQECSKFGYTGSKENYSNEGIFGIRLTIPMDNLKKQG